MIYKAREDVVNDVAEAILRECYEWNTAPNDLTLEQVDEIERAVTWYASPFPESERREALRRTALIAYYDGIMDEVGKILVDPWGAAILDPLAFEIALRLAVFNDALFDARSRLL